MKNDRQFEYRVINNHFLGARTLRFRQYFSTALADGSKIVLLATLDRTQWLGLFFTLFVNSTRGICTYAHWAVVRAPVRSSACPLAGNPIKNQPLHPPPPSIIMNLNPTI